MVLGLPGRVRVRVLLDETEVPTGLGGGPGGGPGGPGGGWGPRGSHPAGRAALRAGNEISGRVRVLVTGAPVRVRRLAAAARGRARARWSETRSAAGGGSSAAHAHTYGDERELYGQRCQLIGGCERDGVEDITVLPIGKHYFPFSFLLPLEPLPTSFEGKYGNVRYWVEAKLQRPWLPVQKTRMEFTVLENVDVNTIALLSPVHVNKEEMVKCWFCMSGSVSIAARINRKGFCPGDTIDIHVEVENGCPRAAQTHAALYQTQTFRAKGHSRTVRQLVATATDHNGGNNNNFDVANDGLLWHGSLRDSLGMVPARQRKDFPHPCVRIPPVSPSIQNCAVLSVEYSLSVWAEVRGASALTVTLPVVVGTVPPLGYAGVRVGAVAPAMIDEPEAPPSYDEVVSATSEGQGVEPVQGAVPGPGPEMGAGHRPSGRPSRRNRLSTARTQAFLQEYSLCPPPVYSKEDPHPVIGGFTKSSHRQDH